MVYYRLYKVRTLDSISSQLNPIHIITTYIFKNHLNIILLFTPRYRKSSVSFRFSDKNFAYISHILSSALCLAHFFLHGLITQMCLVKNEN